MGTKTQNTPKSKHTQGEWFAVRYAGCWNIQLQPYYLMDGNLLDSDDFQEAEANAKLIAAAPELLEVLKYIKECDYFEEDFTQKLRDKINSAIKKATE